MVLVAGADGGKLVAFRHHPSVHVAVNSDEQFLSVADDIGRLGVKANAIEHQQSHVSVQLKGQGSGVGIQAIYQLHGNR